MVRRPRGPPALTGLTKSQRNPVLVSAGMPHSVWMLGASLDGPSCSHWHSSPSTEHEVKALTAECVQALLCV